MKERLALKESILLCGESDGARFTRRFQIVKKESEGAFSLCYEAYHKKSGRGILKEFYPREAAIAAERDSSGQLFFPEHLSAARERFQEQMSRYLAPYQMLLEIKQQGGSEELETFIPDFEIYYGCDEEKNITGSAYIWTTGPRPEPFDKICREIHKQPDVRPEYKMVIALRAIETLTRCICMLHGAGLVHRDIKPSNFGFVRQGGETLTQSLSMFDIDSICSVYDPPVHGMGTEGFMEPEAAYEKPSNQTDIYSIGATLFYAVTGSDETSGSGFRYQEQYYPQLRELVNMSDLVCASEANAHPRLRDALTRILEKSLCRRGSRYSCCEQLLEDLETAIYYALPSQIAKKAKKREKWVLQEEVDALDRNKEKNSALAIQYHLYKNPLYRYLPEDADELFVVLAGFGSYGQKFLDSCLQIGQIRGKKLKVTVLTGDMTDRDLYLMERPELKDFFELDGSRVDGDSYGEISFQLMEFSEDKEENETLLEDFLLDNEDKGSSRPQYIFIALGDDVLNLSAATACRTAVSVLDIPCLVSCVCETSHFPAKKHPGVLPVFVNEDVKKDPNYSEIERMAFNSHLLWEKNLNVNYHSVKAIFQRPYNHDACVSSVLSLKYKLYSIGIDLDKTGTDKAAIMAAGMHLESGKKNNPVKNELIWIEHKRWVTEKLCQGWTRLRNLEECVGGETRDEKRKRHVCLVKSRPDQKLAADFIKNGKYDLWDTAEESELDQLDELDRMSVDLHRAFYKKASQIKKKNLLSGSIMQSIRALLEGNREASRAFQEWYACLQEIWNGDRNKERLYKGLRDDFMEAAQSLPEMSRRSLEEQIDAFEVLFRPVRQSVQYQDYKQEDVILIENIPFILTYTEDLTLVLPFKTGDNTRIFQNVAAATLAGPGRLIYLYQAEKKKDLQELKRTLPYIYRYMKKKELRAETELILIYGDSLLADVETGLTEQLLELGEGRLRRVRPLYAADTEDLLKNLQQYLQKRSQNKKMFALESSGEGLSRLLEGAGFFKKFPVYSFDSEKIAFTRTDQCDMLRFIRKKPFITVADMFSVRRSAGGGHHPEFFEDYRELWDRYRKNTPAWKQMCGALGDRAGLQDQIALFHKKEAGQKSQTAQEFSYLLPFGCSRTLSGILEFLKKYEIAEKGSRVEAFTTGACRVWIEDKSGNRPVYDRLFANVYALMDPEAVSCYLDPKAHMVRVLFDGLQAENVDISGNRKAEILSLLHYFRDKGYIINLKENENNTVDFTYATRQIKELLTTAGKMLEVYTYHKAKETGRFDDVVSSFEIEWEDEPQIKNEFDCIVTKGFRTLFIECKARPEIDQDYYFKIASLVSKFGVNARAVLIADTQEKSYYDSAAVNDMQRQRGGMMGVITVWKKDEIGNIGETLLRIIDGKYEKQEE